MIFKLVSPLRFAIVVSEQIPKDCFLSLNPDFQLSFEGPSRSLLISVIQRMLEVHAGGEQRYLSAGCEDVLQLSVQFILTSWEHCLGCELNFLGSVKRFFSSHMSRSNRIQA